jgi:hypothetical protein
LGHPRNDPADVTLEIHNVCICCEDLLTSWIFSPILGWLSLVTILEEFKDRPVKRAGEADVSSLLAKRVKGVDLGAF